MSMRSLPERQGEQTLNPLAASKVEANPLAKTKVNANPLAAPEVNVNPPAAPEVGATPLVAPRANANSLAAPKVVAIPLVAPSTNARSPRGAADSGADERKRQWRCIVKNGETWFECEDESVESKYTLEAGDKLLGKRWRKVIDVENKDTYYECIDDDVIESKWSLTKGDEEVS